MTTISPADARALFRSGLVSPTTGWSHGFTQANLLSIPSDWAYDALLFAHRNPAACPVLDVTEPGSPRTPLARKADLRTDLPLYRIWVDGELIDERTEVVDLWHSDLVTFLIGCSFTFETWLIDAGVPLRHLEQRRNVPMYVTGRQCRPAGRMRGPMVVSMRPVPVSLVETAIEVTSMMPAVHGAPVHVGDPEPLGIADLDKPDFGDPVIIEPDDVPVYWACGVTLHTAVMASHPPFAITHAPGHMLVTDVPDATYRVGVETAVA